MSCYTPLKGFRTPDGVVFKETGRDDIIGDIELPCGHCIGCRMRRAADWTLRVMHEAQMYQQSCFVTLTYGRDKLPAYGNLEHRDWQLFMKKVRNMYGPVRFYMCGEYGPLHGRPHFHGCLFGIAFRGDRVDGGTSASGNMFYESAALTEMWGYGRATVQDLCKQTAGYCAQYIMKKKLGKDAGRDFEYYDAEGVLHYKVPEYNEMSLKPGIGAWWLKLYPNDVYRHDYVIADGLQQRPPRYYDKQMKAAGKDLDLIEYKRVMRAKDAFAENTDERRRVRELVAEAKVRHLTRDQA